MKNTISAGNRIPIPGFWKEPDQPYAFLGKRLLLLVGFSLLLVSSAWAQVTVSGVVTAAENGEPLPGVNIREQGTTNGTTTNVDGEYELTVAGNESIIMFTYIGFEPQEVAVGERRVINIELSENVQMLSDLVVIGYGQQDRSTLTGSVSSVSSEELQNQPVASTDQLLQGRAAGVQISSNSGTPGGGIFVKIRGTSSISGGSDPLYVVDGVPIETGNFGLGLGGETTSAIADIDPSDIESIEILKDASATAIYGARAANGVVIISTKRGSDAPPSVKVSSYYGFEAPVQRPNLVSGPQFEMLMNEAAINNNEPAPYMNPQNAVDTDWGDTVFRTGNVRNYDVGVSGGNETVRYNISGSNFMQEGVVVPTTYERSSARVNLDIDVTDKLSVGTSSTYSFSNRNRARNNDNITGVLPGVYFMPPNLPVYREDGSYTKFSIFENPVAAANEIDFDMNVNRIIANVFGEYDILDGLSFRTSWSYKNTHFLFIKKVLYVTY